MAELVFFKRGEELMHFTLERPSTTLGRGAQADVSVPDPSVSRIQAVVERRGSRFFLVEPVESEPKPGEAVAPRILKDGDEIRLGEWRAIFHSSSRRERPTDVGKVRLDGTSVQEPAEPPVGLGPIRVRVISPGSERTIPFDSEELTIGKDDENQLVIDDQFVSSFHTRLVQTPRGFWLRDLGSTNGTFIDGKKIAEGEVGLGARIRVGETELILEAHDPAIGTNGFEGMVTRSPLMVQIFELIERVAPTNVQVMILGETGTGKELVAHALHARSSRKDRPFLDLNSGGIPENLWESQLFGHEKGAFTGADRAQAGAFEEASGGTLFFDEIGEMPLAIQPKLLRVLERGEIKRVGSNKTIPVDVRVIAATHRDLPADVRSGRFREDLFYRLNVFPLNLPPLRARTGDVAYLASHILREKAPPGPSPGFHPDAIRKLESHLFPGNVRELRNVIQRALLLRTPGHPIQASDITFDEFNAPGDAPDHLDDDRHLYLPGRSAEECLQEIVERAVRRNSGNRSEAARELKMSRSTVIKRLGEPDDPEP
jgi:DNA-binding NtrC family response regulator